MNTEWKELNNSAMILEKTGKPCQLLEAYDDADSFQSKPHVIKITNKDWREQKILKRIQVFIISRSC